jgi:hypothetical protein
VEKILTAHTECSPHAECLDSMDITEYAYSSSAHKYTHSVHQRLTTCC